MRIRLKRFAKLALLVAVATAVPLNQGCEGAVIGQILQAVLPALMKVYSTEAAAQNGGEVSNYQRASAWGSALSSLLGGVGGVLSRIPTSQPGVTGATGVSGASGRTGSTGPVGATNGPGSSPGVDTGAGGRTGGSGPTGGGNLQPG